jgi:hypothetical protein
MASEDEFDNIPDNLEGIDLDAIPSLSRRQTEEDNAPVRVSTPASSSHYSCDEDIDDLYLATFDTLNAQLNQSEKSMLHDPRELGD